MTQAPELSFFRILFSELSLHLRVCMLGELELLTKLMVFLGKLLGALAPHVAAGGAIANLNFGGFELGLATIGFGFPTIAALDELGKQDAEGGAKALTDLGHCQDFAVHGENLQVSKTNPN